MTKRRPKYLNLVKIKLPLPGFVSILHRVSGALLFLCIPFLLYLLQLSLGSTQAFTALTELLAQPWVRLILLALIWAFLHHLCAGLRFLALDLHHGTTLAAARASSKAVLVVSIVLTLILGARLW